MEHVTPNPEPGASNLKRQVGLRYDDLKPEVRSYVDKLHVLIDAILHKYGVKNPQEFVVKMREKGSKIDPKDRAKVIELMGALIEAYRKDETPVVSEFETIREQQAEELKEFFDQEFEIPPFPEGITPELLAFWKEIGFALKFLPKIKMEEKEKFPGWQHKPGKKFTPNKQWESNFTMIFKKYRTCLRTKIIQSLKT